ncbi:aspartyl protease family protein At5g10770-like [Oryza brachyantha]|uniref:Peptidase A1 domain-containing protein n=1 Tax=Oryza brachyantha TaxID=4533 RepID=J3MYK0_ORYBR|nr:aspartyl protease family protein At5g10770-like [Oryza brachyantha]
MASSPLRQCSLVRGRAFALLAVAALAVVTAPRRIGGAAAPAARTNDPNWHVFRVSSLLPSPACTASKATSNSSALSVVHQHGPCSPLHARRGGAPSHVEILERDQARVNSIHRKVAAAGASVVDPARASKGVSLPAQRGISLGTGNYIVSVGLGTPAKQYSVVFDTGSDLSWVQCTPCSDCYQQNDPLFDPAQSSTYAAVPCGAQECQELDSGTCSSNKCRYEVAYGDQSQTDGNLVRDTLTLSASAKLPGFVFGCGDSNTGLFGQADGLFGLGREKVSLASQGAPNYGPGFTYCLPSSSSGNGYLSLGDAAPANAQFTAMVTNSDNPSFYYLNLVGIKVGGREIRVPTTVFSTAGGTVIDSGTVITRLPPRAYAALRSAFARYMGQYKKAPALSILDTCYDFTGHATAQIPKVALLFEGGATMSLDFTGVLYVSQVSQACLAFASNGDDTSIAILGNTQQKTFAVAYDVANQRIGFGANGCR